MKKKLLILLIFMLGLCYNKVIASNIEGNFALNSNLDLNGEILIVNGNFTHSNGTLNIGNGELIIYGDYILEGYSDSMLRMNDDEGYIKVYGDFSVSSAENELTAGTLEVMGNFNQRTGKDKNGNSTCDNFNPRGTHKVKFSGEGEQFISFDNPDESFFNFVEITNESGLMQFDEFPVKNNIYGNIISDYDIKFYGAAIDLENQNIKAPNIYFYNGGSVYFKDNLTIKSNVYNKETNIYIMGRTKILGNYSSESDFGVLSAKRASGNLCMNNSDGYFLIFGDFYINSADNEFSDGILEVKGNFTQEEGTNKLSQKVYNTFYATDNHKVILSGTGNQSILFKNPNDSRFNYLYNYNLSGVSLSSNCKYNNSVTVYSQLSFGTVNYTQNRFNITLDITPNLCYQDNTLIIAIYEDDKLIGIHTQAPQETVSYSFSYIKNNSSKYLIKAYCWLNLQELIPLCIPDEEEIN